MAVSVNKLTLLQCENGEIITSAEKTSKSTDQTDSRLLRKSGALDEV